MFYWDSVLVLNLAKVDASSYKSYTYNKVNSYIYNKYGQRLNYFRGRKAYVKGGGKVVLSGTIKPIAKENKRYFLNADLNFINPKTEKNYWLSYRKIRGQYYYSLGNGGYIKARNVSTIGKYIVYSNGEKVTAKSGYNFKTVGLWNISKNRFMKEIKNGTTLIINGHALNEDGTMWFKVKNTDL